MFFKISWLILESSQNQLIIDRYIIHNEPSLIEPRTWNNKAQGAKRPERSRSIFPGSNTINRIFCPLTGSLSFVANLLSLFDLYKGFYPFDFLSFSLELFESYALPSFMNFVTYTSWNSSSVFWGVKTFNKLIIWKIDRGRRERKTERKNYLISTFKITFFFPNSKSHTSAITEIKKVEIFLELSHRT